MRVKWIVMSLVGPLLAACAATTDYIPEEHATATLAGRTAAVYPLAHPEGEQQGEVRVASFGMSDVRSSKGDKVKVAHVRLALANEGDEPIAVDARLQRVQLPDGRQLAPAWAKASASALPVVTVPPASSRTLDLFFPLPPDPATGKSKPSQFDVVWRADVGEETITRLTPFDEVAVDPAIARQIAANYLAFGPYDWYDPFWGPAYIGRPGWRY